MGKHRQKEYLPLKLQRALSKLGDDISEARRIRRISVSVMSERASISRATLNKIERGEPSVSFGSYVMVLYVLGLSERLTEIASLANDSTGLRLAQDDIPKRIRNSK